MPLNIREFKGRFKDSHPSTHYEVTVSPPSGGGSEIQLRTESISIPGVAFFSVDNYSPYGNGLTYGIPYRYTPQEISMTHTVDEDGKILQIFRDWASFIVDLDGFEKYGAYYHEDYAVDMTVQLFNRKFKKTNKVKIYEAFPVVIDPVTMSWGDVDSISKLNVSYRFTRYSLA